MTRADKLECAVIAAVAVAWAALAPRSWSGAAGTAIGMAGGLLLAQGLLRDIAKLALRRDSAEKKRIVCLCAESSIGLLLVTSGAALALLGLNQPVTINSLALRLAPLAVLVLGFIAKDYVLVIRKEKDHGSVIVW